MPSSPDRTAPAAPTNRADPTIRAGTVNRAGTTNRAEPTESTDGADHVCHLALGADGPILVSGPVEVTLADGTVARSDRFVVAVCTCRRTAIPPWCDTSHRRRRTPDRRPAANETAGRTTDRTTNETTDKTTDEIADETADEKETGTCT